MHAHGPSCLPGPITRDRDWWSLPAGYDCLLNTDGARHAAPIRHRLVQRIRGEIADGTYDTTDKLEAAQERLLRRLDLE